MRRQQTVALVLLSLAVTGCGIVFGSSFEPDVLIPQANYEIENLRCESKPGESVVDGETVETTHWSVRGDFINALDTGTGTYDLRVNVRFSDGTQVAGGDLIFPMAAGDTIEFSAFLTAAVRLQDPDATVVECSDVKVYDSVLNH